MLQNDPLRERIVSRFDGMSPQLRQAARYILEHPQEVALVSMRELSRNAGVQPSTMTRLAKFLDLPGYDDIRAHHADALRFRADGFAARAMQHSDDEQDMAAAQLSRRMLQGLAAQIARLSEPASLERLSAAAERLAQGSGGAGLPEKRCRSRRFVGQVSCARRGRRAGRRAAARRSWLCRRRPCRGAAG